MVQPASSLLFSAIGRRGGGESRVPGLRMAGERSKPATRIGGRLGLAAAALLLLDACGVQQAAPAPDVPPTAIAMPFVSLAQLQSSGLQQEAQVVLRSAADWANLWARVTSDTDPTIEPPTVDFGQRMVLVVALGRRPTAGFDVAIISVYEDRDRLYVVYRETAPGPGCAPAQSITAPISIVSIAARAKAVSFTKRTATLTCG